MEYQDFPIKKVTIFHIARILNWSWATSQNLLGRLRSAYSRATSSMLYSSFPGEGIAGYTPVETPRRQKVVNDEFRGSDVAAMGRRNLGAESNKPHIGAPTLAGAAIRGWGRVYNRLFYFYFFTKKFITDFGYSDKWERFFFFWKNK